MNPRCLSPRWPDHDLIIIIIIIIIIEALPGPRSAYWEKCVLQAPKKLTYSYLLLDQSVSNLERSTPAFNVFPLPRRP